MPALETTNLTKRFGSVPVLEGLNLRVAEGEVYALVGPNGVGKTTLVHLLLGFLHPTGGEIRVLGQKPGTGRERVGYLPERVRYHSHLSAREYLRALGALSDRRGATLGDRCEAVLRLVGLTSAGDRRLGVFSKGMLQRLGIAQALLHEPDLLLIDEPTSGLDPAGQREMIDLLVELRRQGHTILMCTHQLSEVEEVGDQIGVLSGGRLAAEARVAEVVGSGGIRVVVKSPALSSEIANELLALATGVQVEGREVRVGSDEALQRQVLHRLIDAGYTIAELRPLGRRLEELYLRATRGGDLTGSGAQTITSPTADGEAL
jgi:ABC-2 type transport system ATP-binding protein